MRVPGIVFASRSSLPDEHGDMALAQVADVATLPGIVRAGMRRRSSVQLEDVGACQRLPGSGRLTDGRFSLTSLGAPGPGPVGRRTVAPPRRRRLRGSKRPAPEPNPPAAGHDARGRPDHAEREQGHRKHRGDSGELPETLPAHQRSQRAGQQRPRPPPALPAGGRAGLQANHCRWPTSRWSPESRSGTRPVGRA